MFDPEEQRNQIRRRLLGWGLAVEPTMPGVDIGRDLRLVSGPSGRDFARVSGMENLTQALTLALTTCLGDDTFNVQYGFDGLNALVDETNPVLMRERVRVAVIQVLRKEPRVRKIVDVKLGDGRLEAPPPGSRELDVRVVFEAVSGDSATVDLGVALGAVVPNV